MSSENDDAARRKVAIADYRKKLLNHKELEGRVRSGNRVNKPLFVVFGLYRFYWAYNSIASCEICRSMFFCVRFFV